MARTMLWLGAGITVAFVLIALLAPVISPYDFDAFEANGKRFPQLEAPSRDHLMGTNVQSTDVLSRVIWGTQTELKVVLVSLLFSIGVGVPLGLFSGYFGGKLDRVLVLIMDALLVFPFLLLAIVIAFLLSDRVGQGILTAAIAITVVYIPLYFRVVRNHTISIREEPFVEAARALGAKPLTIIRKYVFFNVVQNVPPLATLNAADAILTLAALGFLGYGIQPTEAAEWGYDVNRAVSDAASGIWWTGLFPGLAIVLLGRRAHPSGRGPQRDGQPGPAKAVDRACRSRGRSEERAAVTAAPVVSVRDLRVYYGTLRGTVRAVDSVSLEIGAGEVLGLVGESGCGKSTLGRGILGLLPEGAVSDGQVLYGGRNLVGLSDRELRRFRGPDLGMIFQEPMTRLNPLMRIGQHFAETLKQHEPRMKDDEVRRRSLETLGKMGIPPTRFDQYPHEFSGGMRQRIMIALALVLRPKLLIADEPTTSLDVIVEAQILSILADLRRNFGTALLLITHNLGIVAEACDRVAVMYAGQIVEEGGGRRWGSTVSLCRRSSRPPTSCSTYALLDHFENAQRRYGTRVRRPRRDGEGHPERPRIADRRHRGWAR